MGIMAELLILEDDIHLRKFYTREFSEDGYHGAEAADSQEALRVLADDLRDLAVLDLVMPGQDGIELLERFVQQTPQLPVVINTAYPVCQHNYLT
jgi:CheY-like chemotaxis protein